jgi:PAS domain S-box-containing protein
MNDFASADANIQTAMLEVISEGISGAVFICDRHDLIVFASQQLLSLLPVPKDFLAPGTRLRDFLGAIYDGGGRFATDSTGPRRLLNREDWIAEQIASLWKERAETTERRGTDRWLSYSKRRLPSGYGICVVRDVSEHKKREEQWRADMERVQITEDVLDNLPFPVTVKDRSLSFVAVNKAACTFFGLAAEDILGRRIGDIIRPEISERFEAVDRAVLETGDPSPVSDRFTTSTGAELVMTGQRRRIGKPGRYFIVAAADVLPSNGVSRDEMVTLDATHLLSSGLRHQSLAAVLPDLTGRKILVVSDDPVAEAASLEALSVAGVDASAVRDESELALFLTLAADAAISVDLVAIDHRMHPACTTIARDRGVEAVAFKHDQPMADLLTMIAASCDGELAPQGEDWQIVPDEVIDVLVAEDNAVNQIVFSQILVGLGYRYLVAADGEEAVRLWREKRPSVVLMDISLPRLNGFEASRAIRALEVEGTHTPIVGVLAQAFDKDRENCFAAGMDSVILKPISPEALEAVFADVPALCNQTQSVAAL